MWRDGCFWISTAEDRLKVKIIKENPHVALIIDTDTRPYKGVIVEGLAELTRSKLSEITLKIVERYVSKKDVKKQFESLMRASRVLIRIRPKKALDIMSYRRH
jgi:nitroimidazol reductase NimA-like FMN-containing flavoprotein (pyridoxamine 5'-phosphate oxidase superfamily)